MKTAQEVLCNIRQNVHNEATRRGIGLGFDALDPRTSLDQLMKAAELLLSPPGSAANPAPPRPTPPAATTKPPAPELTGRARTLAAYERQGFGRT